ncbi:Omp28-related outer membrane protein [Winogradskyella sp. UBA3174]|uniref:Omp28-related outer membrane protein n=1 Tax=Winogradskyella sp. UBA3174 TaxID=1947785 RepID=UPI0025E77AD1|nr:Omp28-related outer membrane protein [Winogradskyella sp. UBA3174]|tara:strand:+ start:22223 stop:23278 length:1056 start_codon:yes stop_codon:yes gene_type:complete
MNTKTIPKLFLTLCLLLSVACSKTEENLPLTIPTAEISVDKLVRKASLVNQNIPFTIINELGIDVTVLATFYVNGEPLDEASFSSDTIGDFEVYGVYIEDGVEVTTNTETFSVIIPKQKIVVEDYTGTWCGFCPRVSAALYSLKGETDDIAVVAIHETTNNFPDPMHFNEVQFLKDAFGVEGFPAAKINRTTNWQIPHLNSDVTGIAGLDTNLAIALNSVLEGNELTVQVNVVYEQGSEQGDKLVVYLLENQILSDQVNYYNSDTTSPYFGLGDVIPDFEHNDVLRESLTGVLGNTIPATAALAEYITSFTINVPADYIVSNLSIVAMVVNDENTAKNAQFAELDEDKAYE